MYPKKTVDQLKAPPYSEVNQDGLNKERANRLVYCQYCKYSLETNIYGVRCGQCKSFMITYLGMNNVQLAK